MKLIILPSNARLTDIVDIFNYIDYSGLLIRTRQTGLSEIEPWNIVVEYVSSDKYTYKKNHFQMNLVQKIFVLIIYFSIILQLIIIL